MNTETLEATINHNISYIEMQFKGHQGSAYAEERMYDQLSPFQEELEKRSNAKNKKATGKCGPVAKNK